MSVVPLFAFNVYIRVFFCVRDMYLACLYIYIRMQSPQHVDGSGVVVQGSYTQPVCAPCRLSRVFPSKCVHSISFVRFPDLFFRAMPPKADRLCDHTSSFFASLPAHTFSAFVDGSACLRCRWAVAAHNIAPVPVVPSAAAADFYPGQPYVQSSDPGAHFRETVTTLREGPYCADDADKVKKACAFLSASMHDGSSSFIRSTFLASGPCDITRKFVLLPDLPDDTLAVQTRARDIKAIDLLGVRFVDGVLKPIARYRHLVLKEDLPLSCERSGVSSEIKAIEYVFTRRIIPVPGVIMPHSKHWSNFFECTYVGLFVSTCPSSELVQAASEMVIDLGKWYRAAHADAFMDRATHAYKHAKLLASEAMAAAAAHRRPRDPRDPTTSTPSTKRPREPGAGGGRGSSRRNPNSPYVLYTKEERVAHGAHLRSLQSTPAVLPAMPPSAAAPVFATALGSLARNPAGGSMLGTSAFSPGTSSQSSHSTWKSSMYGGGRGAGQSGGRGVG